MGYRSGVANFKGRLYATSKGVSVASGDVEIIPAGGTEEYIYIMKLVICNRDDADMDVSIQEDGTATDQLPPQTLPAFGGRLSESFDGIGLRMPTAGTAVDANITNAGADPSWSYFVQYYVDYN